MPRYLLHHRHPPAECAIAYAAFKGQTSPLRHTHTITSCLSGGHEIWWLVDAASAGQALELLPHYLSCRTQAILIRKVLIP